MVTRSTHLCFINQFSKKLHLLASTASDRKGAKFQLDTSWFYPKILSFQNIKIKLNSRTWMTPKSPIVIFQALEPLQPQWPQQPQQPRWPQWPQQPHFIQELPEPDGWIIPGTKMTSTSVFCWMDHQKSNFLLVSDIFSVRGCWGQPLLLFWKLAANTKMS